MSSRIERLAIAASLLLGALGCPDTDRAVPVEPPPPSVNAVIPTAPAAVVQPPPPRVETLGAIVFEFGGKAEVRRGGGGEWMELAVGDAVRVTDEVRTSDEGHLELRFGDARVQVHEGSELTLEFLEARAIRAQVRGQVSGNAADGGELSFKGEGTGAVAVSNGQLSIDANDKRTTAGSLTGGARLTAGNTTVEVRPGELATAQGGAIARSVPIPNRVSLKVSWPPSQTNKPALSLKGKASASARVLVSGQRVETQPDGSFQTQVPLKRGSQSVWVVAIDPLGRRATDKRLITFDPSAPSVRGKVEYR